MELLVVVGVAVILGTVLQRLSGTGVGLILAPVLALTLGPAPGVLLTNATSTMSGFILTLAVWRAVSWRRWIWIVGAATLGVIPGAFVVRTLPPGWLQVIIGATVTFALLATAGLPRLPRVPARVGAIVAGVLGGLLNVTAGVAAPAMVIYARMSRWDQREYGATMQPVFMMLGLMSLVSKSVLGLGHGVSLPSPVMLPVIIGAIVVGTLVGTRLAPYLPAPRARQLAMLLAGAGGIATLIRGLLMVMS